LHHSAIGLHELHSIGVAHQDVKPSNVLVFPVEGSKLTDLGSSSQVGKPSQSDRKFIPGDVSYATPEQWYGWSQSPNFSNRYLVDGLIAFRSDDIEKGRSLYSTAVHGFQRIDDLYAAAMAIYFWAVEEKRIKSQHAWSKIREANREIERHSVFDLEDLVKKL
jgi:serine/threonine protein kinase